MEKLGVALGMLLCVEAAAIGHFEQGDDAGQAARVSRPWSVQVAALGNMLGGASGPMLPRQAADEAMQDAPATDFGPCGGPSATLACAP